MSNGECDGSNPCGYPWRPGSGAGGMKCCCSECEKELWWYPGFDYKCPDCGSYMPPCGPGIG